MLNKSLHKVNFFLQNEENNSLFSLADWNNGGSFNEDDFEVNGLPIIKIAEIKNGITYITNFADEKKHEKYIINKGDLLLSWSGNPDTSIDTFWFEEEKGLLNQHTFKVVPNLNKITKDYMYYLLKYVNKNFILLAKCKQTTGLGHITISDLKKIQVTIPKIKKQEKIAKKLKTFDKKIEINKKTNQTLENLAQEIYRALFIDLEPRKNKSYITNNLLPKSLHDLFLGSSKNSPLGEIPNNWEVKKLGTLIDLKYGKGLKEEDRINGSYPVFGSDGVVGFHDEYLVKGPGIVIGRKGNAGAVNWASKNFYPIDTAFYVKTKGEIKDLYFFYFALKFQNLPFLSSDSAVPGLSKNIANLALQIVPPKKLVEFFGKLAKPLFEKIECNYIENKKLEELRNTLLAKLISGEIDPERI